MTQRPVIGVTLDSEQPGGYSKYPWYAVRQNYADAIIAAGAQGLDRGVGDTGLAGFGLMRKPLELAIPEPAGEQDDELADACRQAGVEAQHQAEVGPFLGKVGAVHRRGKRPDGD